MLLEQAVFTSSKTRRGEGYHVIAKSPGISNDLVVALTRWCPSHASLQSHDVNAESTNFHPLSKDTVVVSRTMYGLKEFSGRGGLQVVTIAAFLRCNQLAGYGNNCFRFARVARSLGHLRWKPHFTEQLPPIEMPNAEWSEASIEQSQAVDLTENAPPQQVADLLQRGQRVAVVVESNPLQVAETIIQTLPPDDRLSCYFTTGLKWSKQRPYRMQLLDSIDRQLSMRIKSHNTRVVVASHAAT